MPSKAFLSTFNMIWARALKSQFTDFDLGDKFRSVLPKYPLSITSLSPCLFHRKWCWENAAQSHRQYWFFQFSHLCLHLHLQKKKWDHTSINKPEKKEKSTFQSLCSMKFTLKSRPLSSQDGHKIDAFKQNAGRPINQSLKRLCHMAKIRPNIKPLIIKPLSLISALARIKAVRIHGNNNGHTTCAIT